LIGLRFHLFEHVEVVLVAGLSHALEDADHAMERLDIVK
jgi:hypothetical protein